MQFQRGNIGVFFRGDQSINAWWILDGNYYDLSGKGNHLTLNGNVVPVPIHGQYHNLSAYKFGGTTSDYLSVNSNSSLKPAKFSILVWVKMSSSEGNTLILSKYSADPCDYEISPGPNGYGFVRSDSSSPTSYYAGYPDSEQQNKIYLKDNKWHLMVGTYDDRLHYYVDGQWKDDSVAFTRANSNTGPLNIGRRPYTGVEAPYSGNVGEVAIFSRALSPQEISRYYKWATGVAKRKYAFEPIQLPQPNFFPFF